MQSFSVFPYEQLSRSALPPNTCSQGHHTGDTASPCVCRGSTLLPREVKGVFLVLAVEMGFAQMCICSSETRQLWDTTDVTGICTLNWARPHNQEAQGKLCVQSEKILH